MIYFTLTSIDWFVYPIVSWTDFAALTRCKFYLFVYLGRSFHLYLYRYTSAMMMMIVTTMTATTHREPHLSSSREISSAQLEEKKLQLQRSLINFILQVTRIPEFINSSQEEWKKYKIITFL